MDGLDMRQDSGGSNQEGQMSEKKGPFDVAIRRISVLVNDHGDGTDAWVWDTIRPVLEAAGRVDREHATTYFEMWLRKAHELLEREDGPCHDGTPCKLASAQIRALLESLPEKEGK